MYRKELLQWLREKEDVSMKGSLQQHALLPVQENQVRIMAAGMF